MLFVTADSSYKHAGIVHIYIQQSFIGSQSIADIVGIFTIAARYFIGDANLTSVHLKIITLIICIIAIPHYECFIVERKNWSFLLPVLKVFK